MAGLCFFGQSGVWVVGACLSRAITHVINKRPAGEGGLDKPDGPHVSVDVRLSLMGFKQRLVKTGGQRTQEFPLISWLPSGTESARVQLS